MTRKSLPKVNLSQSATFATASFGWILTAGGCSLFSPARSSLTDYEEARQSINNPVVIDANDGADGRYEDDGYRPEGVTADKNRGTVGILSKMGFKSPEQKVNKDLARSQFTEAKAIYDRAIALPLEERAPLLRQAAKGFEDAAENWKSSALEQDALYWAGEAYFLAEDYYQADKVIGKLVKEYPRNPYLDRLSKRRLEIGTYWGQLAAAAPKPFFVVNFTDPRRPWNDTGGHGKRLLERIRLDHPTGKASDDATMAIGIEQYRKEDFEGAADTFSDVRMTYPDSEHLFNAQLLELDSLIRSYQGPAYTSLPLMDAEKRIKQIVRQFPTESQEIQQDLNQTYAKIRFLNAERTWEYAERHRKAGANGSAKFHYQKLVDEFSETPFAEQAEVRLEELKDAPDDPPQYFRPLIKVFGADAGERPWKKDE